MRLLFDRRSILRGMLRGTAVAVGIPILDRFLNGSGTVYADGTKLPVRFGTYFWGLGLTDTPTGGTRWVPSKTGFGYEIMPELEALRPVKDKVSVFSGFRAIGDGRPNLVHWSGHASILSGVAPAVTGRFDAPSFDTTIADAIGTSTRFKVIDIDASASRLPVSYSTRTGVTFAMPETTPLALYAKLFGVGFQDPNSDDWKPDPSIVLRQSVLSAIRDQRQALMANVGKADQIKLDQYFTSVRANTKALAKLLALGLACNQTRVFNFVHTAGISETYVPGESKIYHQITHDEPTDTKLGYQPETSRLAGLVMQAFGDFLVELDAVNEGDGTLLDNCLVMAFSDTGYAKIHSIENIPMFLAGKAGGRHKAGQHIHATGESVSRVSLTAQQLVGAPVGQFGTGSMGTVRSIAEVMA